MYLNPPQFFNFTALELPLLVEKDKPESHVHTQSIASSSMQTVCRYAYSGDVDGRFQRDVNGHSGHVNKVGAQRRWDYNHARHLRD